MSSKQQDFLLQLRLFLRPLSIFFCAALLLIIYGCGGGGSGGSGSITTTTGGTFYGKVVAPATLLQRLYAGSARAAMRGNGVSRTLVWLEDYPEIITVTDENGAFTLSNVPLGVAQRIVCRFDVTTTGKLLIVRSAPTTLDSTSPFSQLGELTLEQGKSSISGVLRDQLGAVIANAQLSLWGIKFKSDSEGKFVTPPLPESAGNETIKIEAPGFRPISLEVPFLHSQNNSLAMGITLSDQSEPNFAPVPFFSAAPSQIAPKERVELKILVIDPDELSANQFKPEWLSVSGMIETTADPLTIWWTAPDEPGLATISVKVKDSRGAAGEASIGIAVGGDKNPVIRVTSIAPSAGSPGTKIVISGSGFGNSSSNTHVSFNGTPASVESWSDLKIVALVPPAATTGLLLITSENGEKSAGTFTILDTGLLINTNYGPVGTSVEISGKDFGTQQLDGAVFVNGIQATIESWSDVLVKFKIPGGATGGVITINVRGREKSAGIFRVTRVFSISSEKATLGTTLTVTGEGFGETQAGGTIEFFQGIAAQVVSWTDTRLVIKVPTGAKTGELKAMIQNISFVVANLIINSINTVAPDHGIAGNEMVISGNGFGSTMGSSYVTIGEMRAEVIEWSDVSIKIKIPADTRPGNVIVHANDIISNGFSIIVTGITSISNIRRPSGAPITVNGYGFTQSSGYVFFGDAISTNFSAWQDDKIEVVIPGNATGSAPVLVSIMGVRSNTVPFYVTYFDNIDQTDGWPGKEIVVSGNNFGEASPGDAITFNGVTAPVISWNNSKIHVRVPEKTTTGPMVLTIGSWPIILEADFTVYNTYDYTDLSPDWSGPRVNSRPLLPGLAEDSSGNLFVTDYDNGWVWKLAADGTQTKFGNLSTPWGIAISPVNNNLYVADSGNHSVKIFDLNGNFIQSIGQSGTNDGEFTNPRGISFDKDGRLYVADKGNNRVQVFGETTPHTFLAKFGSLGSGNGQFDTPSGLVVDNSLVIYVADGDNHRIQRFTPNSTTSPTAWNFSGWIGSRDPNTVTPGWLVTGSGLASNRNGEFQNPYGIGLASDSALLVADTNNNRIQVIDSTTGLFVNQIGAAGITSGQYNQPLAVIYQNGFACIADSSNARIQKSTIPGAYISQVMPDTSLLNTNPTRIAVDSKRSRVYVLDTDDGSITVFGIGGNVLQIIGSSGTGNTQFYKPEGLALDPNGNLFVADTGNARIQLISPEGNFIKSWGAYGTGSGQFINPRAITVSHDGELVFVADSQLHKIQKFTKNGTFISSWGSLGNSDDNFNTPSGMAMDKSGNLYIADTQNHRIKKYTSEGSLIGWWGSYDAGAQAFWLDPGSNRTGALSDADGGFDTPTDVALDHEGHVFVTDSGNFRVQRFNIDQAVGPDAGFQGEIYIGENLLTLAIDEWATVYSITSNKTIKRYIPEP